MSVPARPYTIVGRHYASTNSFVPAQSAILAFRRAKTSLRNGAAA